MTSKQVEATVYISMLWRDKRRGKGFSTKELAEAGMTLQDAKIHNIPVDKRRRTSHSWNIQVLNELLKVIPLTDVKGIGKITAAKLEAAGITTAQILARSTLEELAAHGFSKTSIHRWQQNAKTLLDER
jgi:predicted flap endonuclease-1-like 5' DNA nuclease